MKILQLYWGIIIEEIQIYNGFEFTNRLSYSTSIRDRKTLFESKLEDLWIRHKLIKPYTPRHNGKVERNYRKNEERLYYKNVFYSFEDLVNRAKYWIKEYNNFPMKPYFVSTVNSRYTKCIVYDIIISNILIGGLEGWIKILKDFKWTNCLII